MKTGLWLEIQRRYSDPLYPMPQGGLFLDYLYAESVTLWSPSLMLNLLLDSSLSTGPRINSSVLCSPHTCQKRCSRTLAFSWCFYGKKQLNACLFPCIPPFSSSLVLGYLSFLSAQLYIKNILKILSSISSFSRKVVQDILKSSLLIIYSSWLYIFLVDFSSY